MNYFEINIQEPPKINLLKYIKEGWNELSKEDFSKIEKFILDVFQEKLTYAKIYCLSDDLPPHIDRMKKDSIIFLYSLGGSSVITKFYSIPNEKQHIEEVRRIDDISNFVYKVANIQK